MNDIVKCPTPNKAKYASEEGAKEALHNYRKGRFNNNYRVRKPTSGMELHYYKCVCSFYHIGNRK